VDPESIGSMERYFTEEFSIYPKIFLSVADSPDFAIFAQQRLMSK
jgi:hypothetical protein